MHELAVASSIMEEVMRIADEKKAERIVEVIISIGEFSCVVGEQLLLALQTISQKTKAEKCRFKVVREKGKIYCPKCNFVGETTSLPLKTTQLGGLNPLIPLKCPKCGFLGTKIVNGRGVKIVRMKLLRKSNP